MSLSTELRNHHTWPEILSALVARTDLSADQTAWAMGEVLSGEATPSQIAAFAVALRAKGETLDELEGLVAAMHAHAQPLELEGRWLDVVGTGGDRSMSVNISTMAAIVAAAAGACSAVCRLSFVSRCEKPYRPETSESCSTSSKVRRKFRARSRTWLVSSARKEV